MTDREQAENLGHLDDEAEAREPSSTIDGPAAAGDYDPSQGSPHNGTHPVRHDPAPGAAYAADGGGAAEGGS